MAQDETRNIEVLQFGAAYIWGLTVFECSAIQYFTASYSVVQL